MIDTKEEILGKISGHYPDLLISLLMDENAITPSEAFEAMEQYAAPLKDEIERLKKENKTINRALEICFDALKNVFKNNPQAKP